MPAEGVSVSDAASAAAPHTDPGDGSGSPSPAAEPPPPPVAPGTEDFGKGVSQMLLPIASAYSEATNCVETSQGILEEKVRTLSVALGDALAFSNFTLPDPSGGQGHSSYQQRLADVRKRTKALATRMETINARLERTYEMAEKRYGAAKEENDCAMFNRLAREQGIPLADTPTPPAPATSPPAAGDSPPSN
eukprot:Hpha_TRINITY_DN12267_c0_g2::TRINITY_DN12267_c0_g2_i2::g.17030::m.17030